MTEGIFICAALFDTDFNDTCLFKFLVALRPEFEQIRSSIVHRNPLPSLESALSDLLAEETRLQSLAPMSTTNHDNVTISPINHGIAIAASKFRSPSTAYHKTIEHPQAMFLATIFVVTTMVHSRSLDCQFGGH